jgi:ribosomal protein S18 acetylase RimI-like enzyme
MPEDIVIAPAKPKQLSQIEAWAVRNDAVKTLLKTPRDPSTGQAQSSWNWVASRGDEVVAIASVQLNQNHVGYINCIVKPGHQRQGIGSRLFEYVLARPEVKELVHLHAAVDPSNAPARKVLNANGFSRVGYDADGRIEFARHAAQK